MIIYYGIYALILCGVPIGFVANSRYRRTSQALFFVASTTFLILLSGLSANNIKPDDTVYRDWFDLAAAGSAGITDWLREPAYFLASTVVSGLGMAYFVVRLLYALLSVMFYYYFTVVSDSNRWATLYFYIILCRFYLIHDFAEIRAGVAIPLMSVSICLLCSGKKKLAITLYLLALTFHWSVLVGLPVMLLLLAGVKFSSRIWIVSFIPLTGIVLVFLHFIIMRLSFIERLSRYYADPHAAQGLSALSLHFVMHLAVVGWIVWLYWERLSLTQRVAAVCTSAGMFLYLAFIELSAVAYRFEDIFDLFWVLLIITLIQFSCGIKQAIYVLFLTVAGFGLFYVSLIYVNPYVPVLF